jgi:Ca2+-binding RTX toxin-like protein
MIATMIVVSNRKHLGPFVAPLELRIMGWLATAVMAAAVLTMFGYNVTNTGAATTLTGSKFADTLTGGTGADTLVGGTGADSLVGGDGNDLFVVALAADLATGEVITGGNGTDELRFISTVAASTLTLTSGVAVERVVIGTGTAAAAVTTATTAINVSAAALTSAVTLVGNAGINTLTGGSGGDSLDGGAGNDILVGGAGADTLTGGLGNDTFTVASGTDSITDLNGGCCPQSDIVQLHENPRCPGVCQKGVEMNRRDHRRKS